MTREEQNSQSREAIVATAELARQGYEASLLNTALAKSRISKGKMDSYFGNKDQLPLVCVSTCFDGFMKKLHYEYSDRTPTLKECFLLRWEFLKKKVKKTMDILMFGLAKEGIL